MKFKDLWQDIKIGKKVKHESMDNHCFILTKISIVFSNNTDDMPIVLSNLIKHSDGEYRCIPNYALKVEDLENMLFSDKWEIVE